MQTTILNIDGKLYAPIDLDEKLRMFGQTIVFETLNQKQTKDPDELVTYEQLKKMAGIENRAVGQRCKRLNIPTVQHGHSRAIKQKFVEKFKSNK